MAIQRVKSKWLKTNVLLQSDALSRYIPATIAWSREGLGCMLDHYGMVYIKPDIGTFGSGVIRAEREPDSGFCYQLGSQVKEFAALDSMANQLERTTGNRSYLIQRGIDLLRYNGRRFDFRVMVQQNPLKRWETTGIIGRLAHPAKIVTNFHSGGTPLPAELLLEEHLPPAEIAEYKRSLETLGVDVAVQLCSRYSRLKEIGIDIALDTDFKSWILEVNTLPDPYLFRRLPNKQVFRKIYRYCVAYGRIKPRKTAGSSRRKLKRRRLLRA